MSPSDELLFQMQNTAIDLARQLGAAQAGLTCRRELMTDTPKPYSVESAEDLQKSELWRMQQTAISVIVGCNTLKSFKHRKLPSDSPYRTPALADVEKAVCREIRLIEQLNIATDALVYLGGLGDGTSHTNDVAKRALDRIRCTPMPA